jgi:propanol-preferring alcohol dehydrogenase
VPDQISDAEATPLLCAGITAYGAVKKLTTELRITPGKPVAVIGAAGGLGHYVQIAKVFGYRVIGVDIGKEKLEFVSRLGADDAIEASEAEGFVKRHKVDAAIVVSPRVAGYNPAAKMPKTRGGIIAVGVPDSKEGPMNVPLVDLIESGTRIIPSIDGVMHEFQDLFDLYIQGGVRTHLSRKVKLAQINEVHEELRESKYTGRAVATV